MTTDDRRHEDVGTKIARIFLIIVAIIVGIFIVRWAYTEYWISQHCTEVLGTRVCQ